MKRFVTAITISALAVGLVCSTDAGPVRGDSATLSTSKMYQSSRARLALARARGDRTFDVLIVSSTGKNPEVAAAIRGAGGRIVYRADDVDYLDARLPIDRVDEIASRSDVDAICADDSVAVVDRPIRSSDSKSTDGDDLLVHPYRPGDDIGTSALRAAHPTFDGRGTVIAVLDATPDFLLPELQYATALDGSRIPKFFDIRTSADPNDTRTEWNPWFPMRNVITAANGVFAFGGKTYHAPRDGSFRYGVIPMSGTYKEAYATFNKGTDVFIQPSDINKALKGSKKLFGVLWDPQSNVVWLDTNRNDDFSDEKPITDYAVHHEYAVIPVPTDAPDLRPTAGAVVQTDRADGKLAFLFGIAWHASGANGSAAANHEGGGRIDGVAPGAQLVALTPDVGHDLTGFTEGVIWAMRNPKINVVNLEFVSAQSYAPMDGRDVEARVLKRLVEKYDKPIMQPGDNDPGMGKISESGVPDNIFDVAEYQSRSAFRINFGLDVPTRDNSNYGGAYGPAGNGALKPSFVTPSSWLSLQPGFVRAAQNSLKGVYRLPPGYMLFGGTSQATPTAAGAIAVLISAAKQVHLPLTVDRLMAATTQTARFTELRAYVQGSGVLQADKAWAFLVRGRAQALTHLTFDAPVVTATSATLLPANRGEGLFEREGWAAGMQGVRTVFVTRTGNPQATDIYRVMLKGNDGTFAAGSSLRLPLNRATPLRISVAPRTSGAHSMLVALYPKNGTEAAGQMMATIVAGSPLNRALGYAASQRLNVHRPGGSTSMFVTVPENVQALVVRFKSPRAKIQFLPFAPDSSDPFNVSNNLLTGVDLEKGTGQIVFPHPEPGTWELQFADVNDALVHTERAPRATPIVVTASAIQTQVAAADRSVTTRDLAGGIPASTLTRAIARTAAYSTAIHPGEQRIYSISVPDGSIGVGAWLHSTAPSIVNMYLFQCTRVCMLRQKGMNVPTGQYVYSDHPASGHWKIVVDGYVVSPGGTPYGLDDFYLEGVPTNPAPPRSTYDAAVFGALANDPRVYYNDSGPEQGWIEPRKGMNPEIFDVQLLSSKGLP